MKKSKRATTDKSNRRAGRDSEVGRARATDGPAGTVKYQCKSNRQASRDSEVSVMESKSNRRAGRDSSDGEQEQQTGRQGQ